MNSSEFFSGARKSQFTQVVPIAQLPFRLVTSAAAAAAPIVVQLHPPIAGSINRSRRPNVHSFSWQPSNQSITTRGRPAGHNRAASGKTKNDSSSGRRSTWRHSSSMWRFRRCDEISVCGLLLPLPRQFFPLISSNRLGCLVGGQSGEASSSRWSIGPEESFSGS